MKKILGSFLICLAVLLAAYPVQAQTIPISAAIPTMTKAFEIDTIKAGATDSLCIFYVPYSMNVIGLVATAAVVDTTISAGHITATGSIITLKRTYPLTDYPGTTIATTALFTSKVETTGTPSSSSVGKLVVGATYKILAAATANGHLYRLRIEVHYTR